MLLPAPLTEWEPVYLWSVGLLSSFMAQSFVFHRTPGSFKDSSLFSPGIRCCIVMKCHWPHGLWGFTKHQRECCWDLWGAGVNCCFYVLERVKGMFEILKWFTKMKTKWQNLSAGGGDTQLSQQLAATAPQLTAAPRIVWALVAAPGVPRTTPSGTHHRAFP